MDAVTFITKLQKFIRDSYQNIGDAMISGTVDSMEKYKYMQGQANAYQTVIQEISNLLNEGAKKDDKGNVIDLGKGSSKDKSRS
jgi:chitinase